MLAIGDLVCYRNKPSEIGLVVERIKVSGGDYQGVIVDSLLTVLWTSGRKTDEFEIELRKIKKSLDF